MLYHRPQVMVQVDTIDFSRRKSTSYGFDLPTQTALVTFGRQFLTGQTHGFNLIPFFPAGFSRFLTFGGGMTFVGIWITDAAAFASMTQSTGETLLSAMGRAVDSTPPTLHVGRQYPVQQNAYIGSATGTGQGYTPPPQVTFEDLGLVMKVTPRIHS